MIVRNDARASPQPTVIRRERVDLKYGGFSVLLTLTERKLKIDVQFREVRLFWSRAYLEADVRKQDDEWFIDGMLNLIGGEFLKRVKTVLKALIESDKANGRNAEAPMLALQAISVWESTWARRHVLAEQASG